MFEDSKSLETSCYVLGFGAFGIFVRWMQLMIARNDEGLFDPSFWNVAVPVLLIVEAFTFLRIISKFKSERKYVPDSFFKSLKNEGKIYKLCRYAVSFIMLAGSALLAIQCDADKNSVFLYILACLGAVTALSFPFILSSANKPHNEHMGLISFLSSLPILLFGFWLITCYKQNSISSIGWSYVIELITASCSMIAFFRVAGFAFGVPSWTNAMFWSMMGAATCLMSLSDSRYIGQQIMLVGAALMLIMYIWIMISNMRKGRREDDSAADINFEYVN